MDIPIVYLTAYSDENTLERAKQTRLYWLLQKPYVFDVIRSTIEEAIK
jgi:CheY-like chemotaxis protein